MLNDAGKVLLVRRSDSRTLAPPGGGLDRGELPPQGAAREVWEETGLQVEPERLAGLYFWPNEPTPYLTFSFISRLIGGTMRGSNETTQVDFFSTNPLPLTTLPFHRRRVRTSLAHRHERPYWGVQRMNFFEDMGKRLLMRVLYPYWRWSATRQGYDMTNVGFAQYETGAFVIIRNVEGEVLWVKRTDGDVWNLPGGGSEGRETPWETAVRETYEETGLTVTLTDLTGVYFYQQRQHAVFVFTATITDGQPRLGPEAAAFAYVSPGTEPSNALPQHRERVADAVAHTGQTVFRTQPYRVAMTLN